MNSIEFAFEPKERLYALDLLNKNESVGKQVVDSRKETEMLNFFIGYCGSHVIFPIFLNSL